MGVSIWQLLIILVIVLVLFGAKRLRTIGTDIGGAVKGFRDSMKDGEEAQRKAVEPEKVELIASSVIEGEVTKKENDRA